MRSSMRLRPAKPSSVPCQCVIELSPIFQQSRTTWPSTSQGKSSRPMSRSFTCTPMESISAMASLARCSALARSALRRATGTISTCVPPLRKMRCCSACISASTSSMSFLPLMAVRSKDSNTGSSDWASSRVKVRSDMEDASIVAQAVRASSAVGRWSLAASSTALRMTNDRRPTTLLLLLEHFDIEGDGDVVADHAGSAGYAEIHAVDLGGSGCAHALIAPRIFDRRGWSVDIENNFFGHAVNGEIAGDLQLAGSGSFDLLRLEGDRGIFLHVEVVGTAQIVVAHLDAGVHGSGVDGGLDRRLAEIGSVVLHGATYFSECTTNSRDSQMTNRERAAVCGGSICQVSCAAADNVRSRPMASVERVGT